MGGLGWAESCEVLGSLKVNLFSKNGLAER